MTLWSKWESLVNQLEGAFSRKKKDDLINALNPVWDDLYRSVY